MTRLSSVVRRTIFGFAVWGVLAAWAQPATAQPTSLARVLVLGTGGTIAGQATSRAGNAAGKVTAANLVAAIPGIDKLAHHRRTDFLDRFAGHERQGLVRPRARISAILPRTRSTAS